MFIAKSYSLMVDNTYIYTKISQIQIQSKNLYLHDPINTKANADDQTFSSSSYRHQKHS